MHVSTGMFFPNMRQWESVAYGVQESWGFYSFTSTYHVTLLHRRELMGSSVSRSGPE